MTRLDHERTVACITPSRSRIFVFVLLFGAITWSGSAAAEELAAEDVVRLTRAQSPSVVAARQAVALAEAERVEAGLYPNPTIGWDREHFLANGAPGESEDAIVLTFPVDLSGRRAARGHLVEADVAQSGARALRTQSDVVLHALSLFYALIADQQRVGIEQLVVERLTEAARIVGRRAEEGNVSGYDLVRVEIELELSQSRLRQVQARAAMRQTELALLLGLAPSDVTFVGDLSSDARLGGAEVATAERPSLRLLREAVTEASEASDASDWAWVPTLSVSGGLRIGDSDETRYGYVAGITMDLPIFSRGQELGARADARASAARAVADSAARSAHVERSRSGQLLASARAELSRFEEATRERIVRLERAAQSGYREGQRSIVELLDARRASTAVELRRLELAFMVKQAEIALRASTGEFE